MAQREHILISLVEEVLGPRNGPNEILPEDQNPLDEYITGVLAPFSSQRSMDNIESDADTIVVETASLDSQESEASQGDVLVPNTSSPALNPKDLPRSIGLSFTLSGENNEVGIEICCTWARYYSHQCGWQRHPESFLTGPIDIDADCNWSLAPGVALRSRARRVSPTEVRASLFLINTTEVEDMARPTVSDHIFQPQIRVVCCPGSVLAPVRQRGTGDNREDAMDSQISEDASLGLVYRDRSALARGHLCGAVWKSIDPERPHPNIQSPDQAPFGWTDGVSVAEPHRARFSPPDVRTELVPCYPVVAPDMEWNDNFGVAPVLDPEELAATWGSQDLAVALMPMARAYSAWIDAQQNLIPDLHEAQRAVAQDHLQRCQKAVERIREAIDMLTNDEEARLAFCFANKAIALQSRWNRGEVIQWRPFQMAFILLNIASLVDPTHDDRNTCDLLWFPTGGGKTEAYLGLAAFTIALRRLRAKSSGQPDAGNGTAVLSRYTLRLLTIQQFRRALGVITACEFLRVEGLDSPSSLVGWRPKDCARDDTFIWGGSRFSAGLWVGGGVTPNNLDSLGPFPNHGGYTFIAGAIDILKGADLNYQGPDEKLRRNMRTKNLVINGEPAQVLNCPCCNSVLAVPDEGLSPGQHTLHFLFEGGSSRLPSLVQLQGSGWPLSVDSAVEDQLNPLARTLSITFTVPAGNVLLSKQLDEWWYRVIAPAIGSDTNLLCARPARPGYHILGYDDTHPCDFDIFCPNPDCELNKHVWAEQVPLERTVRSVGGPRNGPASQGVPATQTTAELPLTPGKQWQSVPMGCRSGEGRSLSCRIPIPALTTDPQIYHRCPSLVIATVDKFARLAFEPKASSLFGTVTHYHSRWGYYREGAPPSSGALPVGYRAHPPGRAGGVPLHVPVDGFNPPDLILQDELHLIEGPLGSMVGLYEAVIDVLCHGFAGTGPKYIASTATVRQANDQVEALFNRRLAQFPSWGTSADDRFFARDMQAHPLDSDQAGRLYVGICAPGKGAQTPIVRIWSDLLQNVYQRQQTISTTDIDPFWTLVGYFNAIRELAGALALFRQDIPERLSFKNGTQARPLDRWFELSGRSRSLDLPAMLDRLSMPVPNATDAVFTTSMFGTGVDVDRLGLMMVHGQPKTTASYIQATGRVGRRGGALVINLFRAGRPRDLDHYEFFSAYHHALYRYVEPITVAPFSPRAREKALGPLAVILLRHASRLGGHPVDPEWRVQQRISGGFFSQAMRMAAHRHDPEVDIIPEILEGRAAQQPSGRRPARSATASEMASELDRWAALSSLNPGNDTFLYNEPGVYSPPRRHVVLGDAQHRAQGLAEAFENAPQSLREVEDTTGFQV